MTVAKYSRTRLGPTTVRGLPPSEKIIARCRERQKDAVKSHESEQCQGGDEGATGEQCRHHPLATIVDSIDAHSACEGRALGLRHPAGGPRRSAQPHLAGLDGDLAEPRGASAAGRAAHELPHRRRRAVEWRARSRNSKCVYGPSRARGVAMAGSCRTVTVGGQKISSPKLPLCV